MICIRFSDKNCILNSIFPPLSNMVDVYYKRKCAFIPDLDSTGFVCVATFKLI